MRPEKNRQEKERSRKGGRVAGIMESKEGKWGVMGEGEEKGTVDDTSKQIAKQIAELKQI